MCLNCVPKASGSHGGFFSRAMAQLDVPNFKSSSWLLYLDGLQHCEPEMTDRSLQCAKDAERTGVAKDRKRTSGEAWKMARGGLLVG